MEENSKKCCGSHIHHEAAEHIHTHSHWRAAAHATLHCLTGCVIGEFIGLTIGVTLGLSPFAISGFSTALAYITGFALTIFPLMRRTNLSFKNAFHAIWLGEIVSIGIMEIVMNSIDYHMGGMRAGSIINPVFWEALVIAVIAGYAAALPVNAWLIGRQLKKCH